MNTQQRLAQDFANVREDGMRDAPTLRTVAALNPDCSKAEFVAAAVLAGFHPHSANARFLESRKLDREMCDAEFDAEGRAVRPY
jgi:hypothetical protein